MRSFSNLWYWIGIAVIWSSMSHWVLGIPYDLIQRAQRHGEPYYADLLDMVRINVNRLLHIAQISGLWLLAFICAALTSLLLMAFYYDVEFAQAVVLIALPLTIVSGITLSTARLIRSTEPEGEELFKVLNRHRLYTQIVGMIAIFVTAMYGMLHNLAVTPGF